MWSNRKIHFFVLKHEKLISENIRCLLETLRLNCQSMLLNNKRNHISHDNYKGKKFTVDITFFYCEVLIYLCLIILSNIKFRI